MEAAKMDVPPVDHEHTPLSLSVCLEAAKKEWRRLRRVYRTGKGCWRTVDWKRGGKARSNVKRHAYNMMQRVAVSDETREIVEDYLLDKLLKPGYENHEGYIRYALIPNFFDALYANAQSALLQ